VVGNGLKNSGYLWLARPPLCECTSCGAPTNDWKAEEFRCVACTHLESRPRQDLTAADPGHCPRCNP
jgi:hypothetical protein